MERVEFWRMIAAAKPAGGDCEQHAARLVAALRALPATEILDYQCVHDELMAESYTWDLWGAAYLINEGCSADGFDFFRGWLIAQGSSIYEDALTDPDVLASYPMVADRDIRAGPLWCEGILYVGFRAYEAATGHQLSPSTGASDTPIGDEPIGDEWDFDDGAEMTWRYPRLWAALACPPG